MKSYPSSNTFYLCGLFECLTLPTLLILKDRDDFSSMMYCVRLVNWDRYTRNKRSGHCQHSNWCHIHFMYGDVYRLFICYLCINTMTINEMGMTSCYTII